MSKVDAEELKWHTGVRRSRAKNGMMIPEAGQLRKKDPAVEALQEEYSPFSLCDIYLVSMSLSG